MPRKKTRVSTSAPWFLPGGQMVGLRSDLLEVLRALDGRTPRDIRTERKEALALDLDDDPLAVNEQLEDAPDSIGVVSLIGPVTQYEGVCDWMFGGCSLERFMADLEEAAEDEAVASILLVVDSPGGEVAGIADAADRIREISANKPVVVWVPADGCSAAYWLASAGTKIVASQTSMLGSIGVVMTWIDDSKAQEEAGIRVLEFVSSSAPDKRPDPSTKTGKETIQALVDQFGEIFVGAVAKFRGVTTEKVLGDFGQGGVVIGAKAVEAGMADQIGTLDDAIMAAQELARAAGDSTTGKPITTARAVAGQEETMKTAKEVRAEHPEAAAEIAAAGALAERVRIKGILKYNTNAFRAVAGTQIDAAIEDGETTAGDLAVTILDAQAGQNRKVKAARDDDNEDMDDANEPDQSPDEEDEVKAKVKAKGGPRVDLDKSGRDAFAALNGGVK